MDPVDRLPATAALLLGRHRNRLTPSEVGFLEKHHDRGDWQHQDVPVVRAMLPLFARGLLDPLPDDHEDNDAGC
jgi:hypothetical protein